MPLPLVTPKSHASPAVLAFPHCPRVKVTVPAMLDIAYLAFMLACLAGCVFLVEGLSRSGESTPSPGVPSPDAASSDTAGAGR